MGYFDFRKIMNGRNRILPKYPIPLFEIFNFMKKQFTTKDLLPFFNDALKNLIFNDYTSNHLSSLAEKMPVVSGNILEYHFGKQQTDFSFRIGHEDLSNGLNPLQCLSEKELAQSAWKQVVSFAQEWTNTSSPIHSFIENIWFEFDILEGGLTDEKSQKFVPSIFFDTDRNNRLKLAQKLSLLYQALSHFTNHSQLIEGESWQKILNNLPSNAHLYYVGLMLSRIYAEDSLRLCFLHLKPRQILPYLQQIGWKGQTRILENALKAFTNSDDTLILDIDVNEAIGKKVSFEVTNRAFHGWADLFELLVENNLCTSDEATAILNFEDMAAFPKCPLQKYLSKITKREVLYLIQRINHIKFTCAADGTLTVKAYVFWGYY